MLEELAMKRGYIDPLQHNDAHNLSYRGDTALTFAKHELSPPANPYRTHDVYVMLWNLKNINMRIIFYERFWTDTEKKMRTDELMSAIFISLKIM